jgi:hypothetical protein
MCGEKYRRGNYHGVSAYLYREKYVGTLMWQWRLIGTDMAEISKVQSRIDRGK